MKANGKMLESFRFGGLIGFVHVYVWMHACACDVFYSAANVINTLPWERRVGLIFQITNSLLLSPGLPQLGVSKHLMLNYLIWHRKVNNV